MPATRDRIYQEVLQAIVRGRLLPGVRVTEEAVALRTHTSRTPAREALQRLTAEGFLVPRGAGKRLELVVPPLTGADVSELYLGMGALEGVAARAVESLAPAQRARLVDRLSAANDAFKDIGTRTPNDYPRLFELHNAFHDFIVRDCAGPRLSGLIDQLRPHVDRYEWIYAPTVGPSYDDTFDEHDSICAAFAFGDADAAESAVVNNWRNGAERLMAALSRAGSRGDWLLSG
jgi:DNA-binding GntR family transcriptional regulator